MNRQNKFKVISNVVVLLSIVFLVIYLIRNEQLVFLEIKNYYFLLFSGIFLLSGFLADGMSVMVFLNRNSIKISYKQSLIITGKFILAKYIPGKLGIIIGKASYIKENTDISTGEAIQKMFMYQVLAILSALLISIIPLYTFLGKSSDYFLWIILLVCIFIITFAQKKVQVFFLTSFEKIFKKNMGSPMNPGNVIITIFMIMSIWFCWSVGFYFLAKSVGFNVTLNIGFLFPLASLAGILALISPGGIGIREGVITAGLIFYGMQNDSAISLSAFSRIWFLVAELLVFVFALILSIKKSVHE